MRRPTTRLGRLIVFEGPDNVGKTTISKRLVAALRRHGVMAHWQSFPGHARGTLGAEIYALHHARRLRAIDPLSRQLLHIAAHIDLIARHIHPMLRRGDWVVLDRFWWSAEAYGLAGGADKQALLALLAIERRAWKPIIPTLAFLLVREGKSKGVPVSLPKLYKQIADRESKQHPVVMLQNDSTLDALFQHVISTPPLHTLLTR